MDILSVLQAVVLQLRDLFKCKGELRGYDDWDKYIGCVIALEGLIQVFEEMKTDNTEEEDIDG